MAIVKKLTDSNPAVRVQNTTNVLGAPQVIITGTVLNQFGEPLFGAHIFFQSNPSLGSHTDENGKFSISVLPNETELIFSYVTSINRVPVSELHQNIIVTLETGLTNDEVVITAQKSSLIFGFLIFIVILILSISDNRKFNILNN